ncbi:MAG: fasciclin domain-containing protein [Acidobacteria bacterium ACB1]|nr:fasciclin domain-containing protein [Acidobacteria bacterium ACB1]
MRTVIGIVAISIAMVLGVSAQEMNPMVGGAAMFKTKNIVENAVNSKDHTTLVAAVKAAGLVDTLMGAGPFTVFAPTNAAFDMLPAGNVVAGNWDSKAIAKTIKKGGGKAELTTVSGGKLWASMDGDNLVLTDEKGGRSTVTIANVRQSNGIIHVVDSVLMPE